MNATLQQQIASKFLEKLSATEHVSALQIQRLEELLKDRKRPKSEDFVKIFADAGTGDIE